jgi:hypothetical protein
MKMGKIWMLRQIKTEIESYQMKNKTKKIRRKIWDKTILQQLKDKV